MINKIFPYLLQLRILQLEEYDLVRFLKWIKNNFFCRSLEIKKGLKWTFKARAIFSISIILSLIFLLFLVSNRQTRSSASLLIWLFITTQPYLFLTAATLLLFPFEFLVREKIKRQMAAKIKSLPNLKVVGIAGSYGKTSVKEFLYQILRTKYQVIRNPENFNTLLAIAKVVEWELDENYDYFICEIGAYKQGDIREVCQLIKPAYGILTGINEQHLERFGSIKNTIKAKFEIVEYIVGVHNCEPGTPRLWRGRAHNCVPLQNRIIVNADDKIVLANYKFHFPEITLYGFSQERFSLKNIETTENGSRFNLILDGRSYQAQTCLNGKIHLQNILAAATMAYFLKIAPEKIIEAIGNLQQIPHRLEIKQVGGATLIDNAYSSNPTGFRAALEFLKTFSRPKILATPGIVDLGEKSYEIHKKLGETADKICDAVILVGKSIRTESFAAGLSKIEPIYINSVRDLWPTVEKLGFLNPVLLLENDLPENY